MNAYCSAWYTMAQQQVDASIGQSVNRSKYRNAYLRDLRVRMAEKDFAQKVAS